MTTGKKMPRKQVLKAKTYEEKNINILLILV